MAQAKQAVQDFWEAGSCGEAYAESTELTQQITEQATARYQLETYLPLFADFSAGQGKDVLEIGVGMGADHAEWAKAAPASLTGVDLTARAIEWTTKRMQALGLTSILQQADAEKLPFAEAAFDLVYSWGVLHHSPNTAQAFKEVHRVLRPGGSAKIMVYHTWSLTGFMLWARYALLAGKPFSSMATIYAKYLESPHTKAYTKREVRDLLHAAGFADVTVRIQLNHGDLLQGHVGQRHQGRLLAVAKRLWPRWLFKTITPFFGLYLLIDARK